MWPNWNLTYTGGEAAPWTSSGPNASDSSATLKRDDADKEEEERGQSELHVQNSSSGRLASVGRLFFMKPGSRCAVSSCSWSLHFLALSGPTCILVLQFAMGQAEVKNLMTIHMERCVLIAEFIVGLACVWMLLFNEECSVKWKSRFNWRIVVFSVSKGKLTMPVMSSYSSADMLWQL